MASLLAMLAFVMGAAPVVASDEREIPLQLVGDNGIPETSDALFAASLATTGKRTDAEWRTALHDAAALADRMAMQEVQDCCMDIWNRAKPMKCDLCYGLGFTVIVSGRYPNETRTYPRCAVCSGTGRTPGL
jgi:hypothetical protein